MAHIHQPIMTCSGLWGYFSRTTPTCFRLDNQPLVSQTDPLWLCMGYMQFSLFQSDNGGLRMGTCGLQHNNDQSHKLCIHLPLSHTSHPCIHIRIFQGLLPTVHDLVRPHCNSWVQHRLQDISTGCTRSPQYFLVCFYNGMCALLLNHKGSML